MDCPLYFVCSIYSPKITALTADLSYGHFRDRSKETQYENGNFQPVISKGIILILSSLSQSLVFQQSKPNT